MHLHRLSIARSFAFVVCSASVLAALAEVTPPPRDPEAAARAAREANNPMRVIIEASKLKLRIKPDVDGIDAPPTEKRLPRATKPVQAPTLGKVAAPPVAESAKPAPGLAAEPAVAAATSATAPAPAASRPRAPVLSEATVDMPTALSMLAPILPSPKTAVLPPTPLKLVQLVEPSLSKAVMRRMSDDVEVLLGFTVHADGTVSDVVVRSSPIKALEAAVVEAVSQWRYEPIGAARAHTVQLVLRASP